MQHQIYELYQIPKCSCSDIGYQNFLWGHAPAICSTSEDFYKLYVYIFVPYWSICNLFYNLNCSYNYFKTLISINTVLGWFVDCLGI